MVTDLHERIKTASVYVISSDYEGISNAMLEAMYMGLPVITTDHPPGLVRKIIDSETGIVVPMKDEHALAEAICCLADDDEKRLQMRRHNDVRREKAEKNNTTGAQWLRMFESMCRPRS